MDSFFAITSSDLSRDFYPDNSPISFKNALPHGLPTRGEWEVALESLSFDNAVSNLPKEISSSNGHHFSLYPDTFQQSGAATLLSFSLEDRYYQDPKELCGRLKKILPSNAATSNLAAIMTVQQKIAFRVRRSCLYILDSVCRWMQINTTSKTILYVGGDKYVEFDARKAPVDITCNTLNYATTKMPSFIKVKLHEVQPGLSGAGFHRDVAVIPYLPPTKTSPYFFFEAGIKEYFKISPGGLQHLTVTLSDEDERPLELQNGQTTVAKFKFSKMSSRSSFVLRMKSNDSKKEFPDNTPTVFRTLLPHTLHLDGDNWEVALLSVHYPARMKFGPYLKHKETYWYKFIVPTQAGDGSAEENRIWGDFRNNLQIENMRDLVAAMNAKAAAFLAGDSFCSITISGAGVLTIQAASNIKIQFSPQLSYLLFEIRPAAGRLHYEIALSAGQTFAAQNASDINRCWPQNTLLCCDFITPTIMGGSYCKVLKLIPQFGQEETRKTHRTYNSSHLDFADVATDKLSATKFEMIDIGGTPVEFQGEDPTMVSLLFQRKK